MIRKAVTNSGCGYRDTATVSGEQRNVIYDMSGRTVAVKMINSNQSVVGERHVVNDMHSSSFISYNVSDIVVYFFIYLVNLCI